jgi:hypothetical protein
VVGGLFGLIAETLPNGIGRGCGFGGHAASGFRKTIERKVYVVRRDLAMKESHCGV